MKRTNIFLHAAVILTVTGTCPALRAADDSPPPRPQVPAELREQLRNLPPEEREAKLKEWRDQRRAEMEKRREELKNLSPQEREAKLKEWRDRQPEGLPSREEFERRREELKNLSPEERQKRIRELQEQRRAQRPDAKGITMEEREARRKEVRARLDKQLAELRKRKADGTITEAEQKRLVQMEALARRFEQDASGSRAVPPPVHPDRP